MEFSINSKMEEYYKKFIELQEKLRQSEEERLKMELRFRDIVQVSKDEEQAHYRKLRAQYKVFLEEDRKRQDRNERIIRNLERIETKIAMLSAKTERFNILRRQYQNYLKRVLQVKINEPKLTGLQANGAFSEVSSSRELQSKDSSIQATRPNYENPAVVRALEKNKNTEEKIEILDKYLQNLSSQRCRDLLESERRARENLLPFESDRVKFDANQANSVADDIMNSIYSRYYNKDNPISTSQTGAIRTQTEKECLRNWETVVSSDGHSAVEEKGSDAVPFTSDCKEFPAEIDAIFKSKKHLTGNEILQKDLSFENSSKENYEHSENKQLKDSEDNEKSINLKNHIPLKEETARNIEAEEPITSHFNQSKESTPKYVIDQNDLTSENDVLRKIIPNKLDIVETHAELVEHNANKYLDQQCDENNQHQVEPYDEINNSILRNYERNQVEPQLNREYSLSEETNATDKPTTSLEEEVELSQTQQNNVRYDQREMPTDNTHEQSFGRYDENEEAAIKYDKDEQRLTASMTIDQAAYGEQGQAHVTYDGNDQVFQYDENGQRVQYDENEQQIQYDENGQPIQYNTYDPTVQYDQYGQPLLYDENGQPLQQGYDTGLAPQYDENGQLILQYDENGHIIPQYDPNAQFIPQYDQNGQLLLQYDENGEVIPQYDENGQPLQQYTGYEQDYSSFPQEIYDENGQLLENYNNNEQLTQQTQGNVVQNDTVEASNAEKDQSILTPTTVSEEINQNSNEYLMKDEDVISDKTKHDLPNEELLANSKNSREEDCTDESSKKRSSEDINNELKPGSVCDPNDQVKPSNVLQMLDTDSESVKQNTSKISNDSDFEFSNG